MAEPKAKMTKRNRKSAGAAAAERRIERCRHSPVGVTFQSHMALD